MMCLRDWERKAGHSPHCLAFAEGGGAERTHIPGYRLVAQGAGTIVNYKEPSGAGVRVDASGYAGPTLLLARCAA